MSEPRAKHRTVGSPRLLVRAMWLMLRQRRTLRALLVTFALLAIVRAVAFVPLPGVDLDHVLLR